MNGSGSSCVNCVRADVKLADHTRHQIALRLLPFLFILYITNYLDRTSVAYARDWDVANARVQRSGIRVGRGNFLRQLCGIADSRRAHD